MVYIPKNQEPEHPDDFQPSKKRRRSAHTEEQREKPQRKFVTIRWFFYGVVMALLTLLVGGVYAWMRVQEYLAL